MTKAIKKEFLKFINNNKFISSVMIVFLGNSLMGGINFIYHFFSVRLLSSQDYGTFNALVSIFMLFIMTMTPLVLTCTRFFTEHITKGDFSTAYLLFRKLTKHLFITATIIFSITLIFSPFFAQFLKTRPLYIIISGATISLTLFSKAFISLLQSFQKFQTSAIIVSISSFGKFIFGMLLMSLGFRILGGLLGLLLNPILIIIFCLLILPNIFRDKIKDIDKNIPASISLFPIYKFYFPSLIAMLSFTCLTYIDIVLVKHFFSSLEAGHYAIAQFIGKLTLLFPFAVTIVIFPKTTEAFIKNKLSIKFLYKSILLGGLCCILFIGLIFLLPDIMLKILTGNTNPTSSYLLGPYSLAMGFFALLGIMINFSLATSNLKFIIPLLCLAFFEVICIYAYHPSLLAVVRILTFFAVISSAVTFLIIKSTIKTGTEG